MTVALSLSREAASDIETIAAYLAARDSEAARRFSDELWSAFEHISDFPRIGTPVFGFESVRLLPLSKPFTKYLVFYAFKRNTATEIVRVVHASQDIPTRLPKKKKK
jgi:toxin ParE1/3/4